MKYYIKQKNKDLYLIDIENNQQNYTHNKNEAQEFGLGESIIDIIDFLDEECIIVEIKNN